MYTGLAVIQLQNSTGPTTQLLSEINCKEKIDMGTEIEGFYYHNM